MNSGPPNILKQSVVLSVLGRGGTTLLMQLLGTSRQIAFDRVYPFEVRYLTYLLRWSLIPNQSWKPDAGWDANTNFKPPDGLIGPFPYPDSQLWAGQDLWPRCFEGSWQECSRIVIARSREHHQADDDPKYYAEKLHAWAPEYLEQRAIPYGLILLVRDPRDVFLSISAFDKQRGFPGFRKLSILFLL